MSKLLNHAQEMPIRELEKKILHYKETYYAGKPVVTDKVYDALEDVLRHRKPTSKVLKLIDAPLKTRSEKVELDFHLGSMDKVRNTAQIESFLAACHAKFNTTTYTISDKLDGNSMLLSNKTGKVQAFKRSSEGNWGHEVTHLLPHMKGIPDLKKGEAVRCEAIIPKAVFEDLYSEEYENPRNMVAGLLNPNRKEPSEALVNVHLVGYEVLSPRNMKVTAQYQWMKDRGMLVASMITKPEHDVTQGTLEKMLMLRKQKSKYEIDGLILTPDAKLPLCDAGNPEWSCAYKAHDPDMIKEVKCLGVEWNASRHGQIKPRVLIEPTKIGGVIVSYATGHHAKYIIENKIGKGAVLQLVRSGDVIPYILSVKKSGKVNLPEVDYKWDKTNTNLLLDEESEDQQVKAIANFFAVVGVEDCRVGTIRKVFDAGHTTIADVLSLTVPQVMKIEGFQKRSAEKLVASIQRVCSKPISLPTLMAASGCFSIGLGETKFEYLVDAYPKIMMKVRDKDFRITEPQLAKVDKFGPSTVALFYAGLPKFQKFLRRTGLTYRLPKTEKVEVKGKKYQGQFVTFTGFRDEALAKKVQEQGGAMVDFGKKTTVLVYKDGKENSKTDRFTGTKVPLSKFKV